MSQPIYETPRQWAERQFGKCQLGDRRRTRRAVAIGEAMLEAPGKSIPGQMKSWKATKAAYRFFSEEAYQFQDLSEPHWQQTRTQAQGHGVVLMVQDLTQLDYSAYRHIRGLAPIGDNRGLGLLLTTVLSVVPAPRQVLGIAYQEPFFRQLRAAPETRRQRQKRAKESDVWAHAVQAIGSPPAGVRWVHLGDRGADIYAFFEACLQEKSDFLVRVCQNRKMSTVAGQVTYLRDFAAQLPALAEQELALPARAGRPGRTSRVQLALAPLTLAAGWMNRGRPPLPLWVVRVWEPDPPPETEPLEWLLLTSVPTETVAQAWERVAWYRCRWLVEEFHQCLKSGCQIERRRLEEAASLLRLLGLLAPVAVQLLILREQARLQPDRPALNLFPADLVQVVAHLAERSAQELTLQDFWRQIAQQGGFLGRTRDGPPGWKTLWQGWFYVQTLLTGFRLAAPPAPT